MNAGTAPSPDIMAAIRAAAAGERAPLVMGVLNVTPDSFSDGGLAFSPERAAMRAGELAGAGADIVDLGAESTRPGATPISAAEECERLLPALGAVIAAAPGCAISLDTRRPETLLAALAAHPDRNFLWNDVSGLRFSPDSLATAARFAGPVIIMHAQGAPADMQDAPRYGDVVADIACWLENRARIAIKAGIAAERIVIDPGIGFGKRADHNLALLRDLPALTGLGYPVAVGASRKRFIAALAPSADAPSDRLGGSIAGALWAGMRGAAILRVHDVAETAQALNIWRAIASARRPVPDRA